MKRSEIIAAFRDRIDDAAQPYLWPDPEVYRYLNDAHRQAALRARLIRDSTTVAIRQLTVSANATNVGLSPLVLEVLKARLSGVVAPLHIITADQMDEEDYGWESSSAGTPSHLVLERNGAGLKGRLWPTPAAIVVLLMTVIRLPLSDLNTDDDEPEIPVQYHEQLVDWMLRQAHLKRDSETFDKEASKEAEARFIVSFGELPDANVLRKQADKRPSVVRFQEF